MDFGLSKHPVSSKAAATLKDKENNTVGTVLFTEYILGDFPYVHIHIDLENVPEGTHAVHVHETGDCGEDFKCAGGHFDPGPAGNSDPDANHPFHAGDLPNIVVSSDGRGTLDALSTRFCLSDGPRSILSTKDGTSLMIHANPDPYTTGESGSGHSGGPRIACGVIEQINNR